MRILVVSYEFPPLGGGAASVCHNIAKELVVNGHEVDIVTMGYKGLAKHEVIDGIGIYRVPCLRSKEEICHTYEMISYSFCALPTLIKLQRKKKYDINHTHFIFPSAFSSYLLKKFTGLPYIVTAHGSDVPGYNPDRFKMEHTVLGPIWRILVRNADLITSPSQSLKDRIVGLCDATPVEVIPNAVDVSAFQPKDKKNRILMASRLLPRKGFQYVLEALSEIEEEIDTVIMGEGPFGETLKRMARDKEMNVRFTGWLEKDSPELRELFETSSIFALPSEMENFSIALVEAMAGGMAILTTDAGGNLEVVADTALAVAPRDVGAMRESLARLVGDASLREDLGRRARKRVVDNFTWQVVTRKYEDLFAKTMKS